MSLCHVGYRPRIGISCWSRVVGMTMGGRKQDAPNCIYLDEKVTTWNHHLRVAIVLHVNLYESKKIPLVGIV